MLCCIRYTVLFFCLLYEERISPDRARNHHKEHPTQTQYNFKKQCGISDIKPNHDKPSCSSYVVTISSLQCL